MFFVFKNVCTVSRFTFHIKSAAVSFLFVCWTETCCTFSIQSKPLNNIYSLQNGVWKKSKIASQFISQLFVLVGRVVTPAKPQAIQLQCLFLYCILFRWTYSNCRKHLMGQLRQIFNSESFNILRIAIRKHYPSMAKNSYSLILFKARNRVSKNL
jgi:hypothetical protein